MDCRTIKKQGVTPIDNWDRYEKNFFLDSHRNNCSPSYCP